MHDRVTCCPVARRAVETAVLRTLVPVTVPSDQELVVDFLNTLDVAAGTDVLDDPSAWRRWVDEHRIGVSGASHRARAARDALRAAAAQEVSPALTMNEAPDGSGGRWRGIPVTARLEQGRPVLTSTDAVGAVLAAAIRLAVVGDWDRVKLCPAGDCGWAFFDRSKNRSRTWCSMRVCGNRDKARNWRARSRVS